MINVVITTIDEEILKIRIKGHAYSGEPGHDLVCAGVSAVRIGALNSLHEVDTAFKVTVEDGLVEIVPLYRPSYENKIVLQVLITSLKTIAESYGKYVQIREERRAQA